MSDLSRWGTTFEPHERGAVLRGPGGAPLASVQDQRVWVRRAPGLGRDRDLFLEDAGDHHAILGPCLRVRCGGERRTLMGWIDWRSPSMIPPVAEPARLPPLTGTMVLNLLALCAQRAGIRELRYRGPYPSAALYTSLRQCFDASGDEAAFTARGAELLVAPRLVTSEVAFAPAPFARWWLTPRLGAQARARIERVFVDGANFERAATGPRRLVAYGRDGQPARGDDAATATLAAELWFGDRCWARRAELSADGALCRGPWPPPTLDDPIVGQELPLALRRALAELIADAVPTPVSPLVAPLLERARLCWGDAGDAAVRDVPTGDHVRGAIVHAALWLSLRGHGAARVALALAEALTPWVVAQAVRDADRATSPRAAR
ncbi:MAG: hypothetical protein R3B48_29070 [Kofleriaceae bacterium]